MSTADQHGLSKLLEDLSVRPELQQDNDTHYLTNPLDLLRNSLARLLKTIVNCQAEDAYKSIQWPNDISNGDLSVTLPRLRPGCKPKELSTQIVDELKFPKDHALFESPLPDGVHLRVFLRLEIVSRLMLPYILDRNSQYGNMSNAGLASVQRKKLIVEFSSPNITREMQGKHLRSTIVGSFIARIHDAMGWDVTRLNYLGDWGKPIALLYVGWAKFGSEESFNTDPIGHILDVYDKIDALFQPENAASKHARDEAAKEGKDEGEAQLEIESKGIFAERNEASKRLEAGDEELVAFWKRIRQAIVDDYEVFYERLGGVHFDSYSGESEVKPESMTEVEAMLKEKQISEESAGASMVDMTKLGSKAGHAIIRDRSGNSMYLLRDLAAVFERSKKYSFDKMIYVAASDNSVHFTQMFKILEALDKDLASKVQHVKFSEISKMVATLGKGYKPLAILEHCEEAMRKLPDVDANKSAVVGNSEQAVKTLATSALLVQELSTRSSSAHSFDTGAMASFKLGSGPDLQHWYAKLSSLLTGHTVTAHLSDEEFEALADEDQANLLRVLAQYPEVVSAAYHSLEPSGIVTYLAGVTEQLSDALDGEEGGFELTRGFAALLGAARIVLENGMKLLGLTPVDAIAQERADSPLAG